MADARVAAFVLWFLSVGTAQLVLAEGGLQLASPLAPAILQLAVFGSILATGILGCALALAGSGRTQALLRLLLRWREAAGPDALVEQALALDEQPGDGTGAVASAGGCLAATCAVLGCWSLLFALTPLR